MRRAKRGEVWHINGHGRTCGSEQHSDRPAVIVSNDKNNKKQRDSRNCVHNDTVEAGTSDTLHDQSDRKGKHSAL